MQWNDYKLLIHPRFKLSRHSGLRLLFSDWLECGVKETVSLRLLHISLFFALFLSRSLSLSLSFFRRDRCSGLIESKRSITIYCRYLIRSHGHRPKTQDFKFHVYIYFFYIQIFICIDYRVKNKFSTPLTVDNVGSTIKNGQFRLFDGYMTKQKSISSAESFSSGSQNDASTTSTSCAFHIFLIFLLLSILLFYFLYLLFIYFFQFLALVLVAIFSVSVFGISMFVLSLSIALVRSIIVFIEVISCLVYSHLDPFATVTSM